MAKQSNSFGGTRFLVKVSGVRSHYAGIDQAQPFPIPFSTRRDLGTVLFAFLLAVTNLESMLVLVAVFAASGLGHKV